jgi:hypothetical protein
MSRSEIISNRPCTNLRFSGASHSQQYHRRDADQQVVPDRQWRHSASLGRLVGMTEQGTRLTRLLGWLRNFADARRSKAARPGCGSIRRDRGGSDSRAAPEAAASGIPGRGC